MIDINVYTQNPYNNSWVISLLIEVFRNSKIVDPWNRVKTLNYLEKNLLEIDHLLYDNIIVCIDDETFEGKEGDIKLISDFFKEQIPIFFKKCIFIFKTKKLYNESIKNNLKSVYFPYFDIMEDLISFSKLNRSLKNNVKDNKSFFNLNGIYNEVRHFLLTTLERYSLMKSGYVTCNFKEKVSYSILRKIRNDTFGEQIYFNNNNLPCDRLFHDFNTIPCTLNLKNYFYICENVPGSIYLGVESCTPSNISLSLRSPSDKTIIPFICKRLPLIIGDYEKLEKLESEGFDVFNDILNHSYSKIKMENYEEKVITCIDKNYQVLKNNDFLNSNEIENRLSSNQKFLINRWYNNQINKFVENVKNEMVK
jgi:hypothetical protein